jgi:hypothetical protein
MRALLIAKRSGREARITCLNQLRHLGFCAPDELRERFRDVPRDQLADVAAALRPRSDSDPVTYATKLAMRTLARRVLTLVEDNNALDGILAELAAATAPSSPPPRQGCSSSTASASTPRPSCWSPLATTPNGSGPKQPGRTCAVSHHCPPPPAR